jgi:small-conductance mechanosensitive channel
MMSYLDTALQAAAQSVPAIGSGLAVMLAFWAAAVALRAGFSRLGRRLGLEAAGLTRFVSSVVYWSVVACGIVTGLGTMGVNVAALVASLGLTGFALGFALRDAISNVLAGLMILIYHPFRHGDRIKVVGFEGTVIAIDLRYTTLGGTGERHLIPNQTMHTNPVTVVAPETTMARP